MPGTFLGISGNSRVTLSLEVNGELNVPPVTVRALIMKSEGIQAELRKDRYYSFGRSSLALHDVAQLILWRLALLSGCHQRAERSFFVNGRQVPLCARCLGLLIGLFLAPIYRANLGVSLALISVFVLDGFTQLMRVRQSRNWLRFSSGLGFSMACANCVVRVFGYIWNT